MEEKTVYIPAISCGHCVMTIKREVEDLEGIQSVEADEKTKWLLSSGTTGLHGRRSLVP